MVVRESGNSRLDRKFYFADEKQHGNTDDSEAGRGPFQDRDNIILRTIEFKKELNYKIV